MAERSKRIQIYDKEKMEHINPETLKLFQKYQIDMSIRDLSPNSIQAYNADLKQWFIFMYDNQFNLSVLEATEDDITEYYYWRKQKGNNVNRQKRVMASISAFYKFLRKKKLIVESPVEFIDRPKAGQPIAVQTYLTKEQVQLMREKLEEYSDIQLQLYAFLSLTTMARVNAIASLKWDQIDFDERICSNVLEKEGKIVELSFSKEVKEYMEKLIQYRNTGKYTNTKIAEKLNLATNTTSHYLRMGTKLGVCDYNGQAERNKASAHPIVLTNTGEVFDFMEDAIKKYGKLNISGCCRGEINSAGKMADGTPMIWRYLEDYDRNKDYKYDNAVIKKIVCLDTNEVFDKIVDACRSYRVSDSCISSNLIGRNSFAARDKKTKMPLHWMYYNEFISASKEDIEMKINSTPLRYSSIICLNDLKIFESASSALSHCGLKNVSSITDCCKGRRKHAGTINGEPCSWMYYKDYIKEFGEVIKIA